MINPVVAGGDGALAPLDRPPPASRLHRERQLKASEFCNREVA